MILVAFFLFVIGYNILGNNMGGLEGFREGATDNSKFTEKNIADIIKCADPKGIKSPYSSSDISDMLSGDSYTMSGGDVKCSSDKKSDKKSDSKSSESSGTAKKENTGESTESSSK